MTDRMAKFQIGQVVKHRLYPFRGVIFDVDPEFNNTEEWYEAMAISRPVTTPLVGLPTRTDS